MKLPKISMFIAHGCNAFVFRLADGNALKLQYYSDLDEKEEARERCLEEYQK